jgi:uncharacterized membrane protein YqjE
MTNDFEADEQSENESLGLFASLRALLRRVIALLQTRAELFTTELEEEVTRLIALLIWSFVGVQCAIIGLTFVAVAVVLFIPEQYRAWIAGGIAVLFLGIAAAGGIFIKKIVGAKARPFDATLRELAKDRDRLKERR